MTSEPRREKRNAVRVALGGAVVLAAILVASTMIRAPGRAATGLWHSPGPVRQVMVGEGVFSPKRSGSSSLGIALSDGLSYACGLLPSDRISCWGGNPLSNELLPHPPTGSFKALPVGGDSYVCGLRTGGNVSCWGTNRYIASRPRGRFRQISAGADFACGVLLSGRARCWGRGAFGETSPPPGTFVQVSAGASTACGVRRRGRLSCWGARSSGHMRPPPGHFRSVTVGIGDADSLPFACALSRNDRLACWGPSEGGEIPPYRLPSSPWRFRSFSAGSWAGRGVFACGLR